MGSLDFLNDNLTTDSPCPPMTAPIRLYGHQFSIFSHRVKLVLTAKNLDHEVVCINLKDKPTWFKDKNPFEKVPVLELEGNKRLRESRIICEYLDEAHEGARKLLHTEPWTRAKDRLLVEEVNNGMQEFMMGCLFKTATPTESFEKLHKVIKPINDRLKRYSVKFFGPEEEQPGMTDYLMWPWFETLPALLMVTLQKQEGGEECTFDSLCSKLTEFASYHQAMQQDPAVIQCAYSTELRCEFLSNISKYLNIPI